MSKLNIVFLRKQKRENDSRSATDFMARYLKKDIEVEDAAAGGGADRARPGHEQDTYIGPE